MSTTMTPPSASMSPVSTEAMILDVLNSGEPAGGSAAQPEITDDTLQEIAGVPDTDSEETAEAAEPEKVEEPEKTETVDEDAKPEIENLTETRWKQVHRGYKFAQELGRAFGVVGADNKLDPTLLPSVEEFKGMRNAYGERLAMEHDFASGDPRNAMQFVQNWDKFSPEGMKQVASVLPEYLAKANPQAYLQIAQPVIGRFMDHAYRAAVATPDPVERDARLNALRWQEWWSTGGENGGTFRSDEQIQRLMTQGASPQPQNPNAPDQQLARTQAELQQLRQQEQQTRWAAFSADVDSKGVKTVEAEIDTALSPLKAHYPNPVAFNSIRSEFINQVKAAINSDSHSANQYQMALERAQREMSPEAAQNLLNQYQMMYRRAIHTTRGKFVTPALEGVKAASDAKHETLRKAAAKVGATAPGTPREQSILPKVERQRGESANAYTERLMKQMLGS